MVQVVVGNLLREAGRRFIQHIFEPQSTDDTDEIVCIKQGGIPSGYTKDGHLICLPKPSPPANISPSQPIPKVSEPPKYIYRDRPTVIDIPPPELPERRLNPKLPTGGGRSVSTLKKVITVNKAIKSADYGHLLHEPITNSPVTFQVCKSGDYGKELERKQKFAAEKFFDTLIIAESSDSTPELPQPSYSMSEQSITLVSGVDYTVGALFGIEGINDFISSFLSRNFIPNLPITGVIPLNYEYIDCSHKETEISEVLNNLTVVNIQEYIESLGLDSVSNQLNTILAKSGATSGTTSIADYTHNQLASLLAKTKVQASAQEYLLNQIVSLSAKSGATISSDALGQEYLHNQLISSSVKNFSTNINKLLEVVGIDDFPINVPETLIASIAQTDLVNPPSISHKDLTSIPQLIHWFVERFDEVMGQWVVPIEVKDTDPTTVGDQSKLMVFPNIAELLAEMMMIMFQVSINSEVLTNISTRLLMEAGQDKQQNFITYKLLQSLTDYVGYSYKDKIVEMPLLFDPKAKSFDKMLTEVQIKVPVPEFDEKFNLQADFMRFRKAASILDSVYFRKVDPNGDIKAQLMKRLFDLRDLLKEANKEDDNFKEFLKQVEAGFTGTPGVGDSTKPYGRDYEDRPKIRDINSQGIIDDI